MPIGPWLLLTMTLVAPSGLARGQAEAAAVASDGQQIEQRGRRTSTHPPHRFGLGGALGVSSRGAGGGMRYWFGERVGLDTTVAWYRGQRYSSTVSSSSTLLIMPSMLVLLTTPDPTRDVDVRPFVGGGLNYVRGGFVSPPTDQTASVRGGAVGLQAFGGIEMTFKEFTSIAFSAEVAYYRLPVRVATASVADGVNYFILFHYYLK